MQYSRPSLDIPEGLDSPTVKSGAATTDSGDTLTSQRGGETAPQYLALTPIGNDWMTRAAVVGREREPSFAPCYSSAQEEPSFPRGGGPGPSIPPPLVAMEAVSLGPVIAVPSPPPPAEESFPLQQTGHVRVGGEAEAKARLSPEEKDAPQEGGAAVMERLESMSSSIFKVRKMHTTITGGYRGYRGYYTGVACVTEGCVFS